MITLHLEDAVIKSLSSNELNILKFVYEHGEDILNMSIKEFSSQVSYSTSTVLRFCRKLGYSGFAEFKYMLRSQAKKKEVQPVSHKQQNFNISKYMDTLNFNMEGTSSLISEEQLSRAFRYFDSGCPIYVWAPGGITSIVSSYFEKLLVSIGRQNVYLLESAKMTTHILQHVSSDCLLVLISTAGTFEPTIRLGKLASMNHIPVLTITPYTNNILADLSTISFRFFTNPRENRGAEFTSRLPVFYVIHILILSYLQYKRQGGFYDTTV
ncbi:MAG: MurR/RpiR family transcriptional regulator [Enterocloster sp.]